jgi:hypothetical protein
VGNIIPGYDFAATEIPRFATMLLQAQGLEVQNLTLDDISMANIVGMTRGNTSDATGSSLPAEGWMWSDPTGNVWIETTWETPVSERVRCQLYRTLGGWASVRYPFHGPSGSGAEGAQVNPVTNYFNEEDVRVFEQHNNFLADGGKGLACVHECSVSGPRAMVIGRGGFTAQVAGSIALGDGDTRKLVRNASAGWSFGDATATLGVRPHKGTWLGPDGGSTVGASYTVKLLFHYYAGPVWGP